MYLEWWDVSQEGSMGTWSGGMGAWSVDMRAWSGGNALPGMAMAASPIYGLPVGKRRRQEMRSPPRIVLDKYPNFILEGYEEA